MPRTLINRCQPDSIREFRAAAAERYLDGASAAHAGRRTAAIYLWGYVAEMTLRAAYFDAIGYPLGRHITAADLRAASNNSRRLNFSWVGNLHNLDSWAQLLVLTRTSTVPRSVSYSGKRFASRVVAVVRRMRPLWNESLRYHKNLAYDHEVRRVRDATSWLIDHTYEL